MEICHVRWACEILNGGFLSQLSSYRGETRKLAKNKYKNISLWKYRARGNK